jgi:hypothetical protein
MRLIDCNKTGAVALAVRRPLDPARSRCSRLGAPADRFVFREGADRLRRPGCEPEAETGGEIER